MGTDLETRTPEENLQNLPLVTFRTEVLASSPLVTLITADVVIKGEMVISYQDTFKPDSANSLLNLQFEMRDRIISENPSISMVFPNSIESASESSVEGDLFGNTEDAQPTKDTESVNADPGLEEETIQGSQASSSDELSDESIDESENSPSVESTSDSESLDSKDDSSELEDVQNTSSKSSKQSKRANSGNRRSLKGPSRKVLCASKVVRSQKASEHPSFAETTGSKPAAQASS